MFTKPQLTPTEIRRKLIDQNKWLKYHEFTILLRREEVLAKGLRFRYREKKFGGTPAFELTVENGIKI